MRVCYVSVAWDTNSVVATGATANEMLVWNN